MKVTRSRDAVCVGILLFINGLFALKYAGRVTDLAPVITAALLLVQGAVLYRAERLAKSRLARSGYLVPYLIVAGLLVLALLVTVYVPLATLNVDRWSVIDSFLRALAEGSYPYGAESHLGNPPGPLPIYFLVAFPFWKLGLLSLLAVAGYVVAALYLGKRNFALVVVLLTSPFMYWEVAVRSNVFTFSALVLAGLVWYERWVYRERVRPSNWQAVACGLLLATRSVFLLAYLIYFCGALRRKYWDLPTFLRFGILAALVFIIPLLPFWMVWPQQFAEVNPLLVQSGFLLPPYYIGLFVLLALGVSTLVRTSPAFWSGLVLFLTILIYAGYHVVTAGFSEAYFGSRIDLSYFLFCVPFLLYELRHCPAQR